ncbi:N-acyl-D-amino-acid deacylase family protein [Motilimonas sp. KMU-193]|uniref:N-acyl-D-amino-acid deacylase family protein n=1 Tax=Motilimonas sp. KMU-193 TaxID=3388668 RepID=UPI00396B05C8
MSTIIEQAANITQLADHGYEQVIRDVLLIDGSGNSAYQGDVAIQGERIAAIAPANSLVGQAIIDGKGLVLAPGFVDVHTHDDTNVIRDPDMLCKISQGITTVIVGNCGISASPVTLDGPPPDPMNLLGRQEDFVYPQFADYVAAVKAAVPRVNVAALVGHTALRNNYMADLYQTANQQQIDLMRQQLRQAMAQGALGLSSGLAYASAHQASTDEVMALVAELADFNGIYTTHMRTEFDAILEAMEEAFSTAEHGGVPLIISHLKCAGAANWGRTTETLAYLEQQASKQKVACDCYPYSASSSTLDLNQVTEDFDIFITWSDPEPSQAGRLLKEIAADWQVSLMTAAKRLQPAGAVYHGLHPDDVKRVLSYPRTMVGSDGLPNDPHPHPRLWGAFPRVLGHYCREQKLFDLPTAVHKMTGLSAKEFGLGHRGLIQTGYYADLVLFDADTIADKATFTDPIQAAQGIHQVWVNGVSAYQNNQLTAQRAGRFLPRASVKTN